MSHSSTKLWEEMRRNSLDSSESVSSSLCLSSSSDCTESSHGDSQNGVADTNSNVICNLKKCMKKASEETNSVRDVQKAESTFSMAFKKFSQLLAPPVPKKYQSRNTFLNKIPILLEIHFSKQIKDYGFYGVYGQIPDKAI